MGGNGTSYGNSITVDANENILIIGEFSLTVDFDPGSGVDSMTAPGNINVRNVFVHKMCPCTSSFFVDTSLCLTLSPVGIFDNSFEETFIFYPNPTEGLVALGFWKSQQLIELELFDITGKQIDKRTYEDYSSVTYEINQMPGVYLLQISDMNNSNAFIRVVKK